MNKQSPSLLRRLLLQLRRLCNRKVPSIWQPLARHLRQQQANSEAERRSVPQPELKAIAFSRDSVVESLNAILARSPTEPPTEPDYASSSQPKPNGKQARSPRTDTPTAIKALSDSAYLCECQGRYAEAERLYKQVIILWRQKYGARHLSIADSLEDLAGLYCRHHQHKRAEPLLRRALLIRQRHQSVAHPNILNCLRQLANIYCKQAQYAKAKSLLQQALEISLQSLGSQHAQTHLIHNDLMQMLAIAIERGNYAELIAEIPPLDLDNLSEKYSWAKPPWQNPPAS